jgi:hypothetical protein
MSDNIEDIWLPIIGRSLALLCLDHVEGKSPERVDGVIKKVRFLEALGLPRPDAAQIIGSNAESVRVMIAQAEKRHRGKSFKKK